jgi:uncharacterized protein (UPF0332 family)
LTLSESERSTLIKHRLEQADETIADVELLVKNNRFRSAINRIYYGMFYSLLALALAYKFESSKHAQIIGWFNKSFIHTGKIEERFGKIINKAFNKRTKSDYDTFVEIDEKAVKEMLKEMKEFVFEIKKFLNIS